MIPHIDFTRRKEQHTEKAIRFAETLQATPILIEIYYPGMFPSPPSYYIMSRGTALPLSRSNADKQSYLLKLTYMPDGERIFTWTR